MLRGYRNVVLAALGCVSLGAAGKEAGGVAANGSNKNHQANVADHQAGKGEDKATKVKSAHKARETERAEKRQQSADDRDNRNVAAAEKAADAAFRQANLASQQTWIGGIGLMALVGTLYAQAVATSAAKRAVVAQITTVRPIMSISSLSIRQLTDSKPGAIKIMLMWAIKNSGQSGCWMERVSWTLVTSMSGDETAKVQPCESFLAQGEGVSSHNIGPVWEFDATESEWLSGTKSLTVWGHTIYRNAAGHRWRTGFIYSVFLDANLNSTDFSPFPASGYWADVEMPSYERKWYQRSHRV